MKHLLFILIFLSGISILISCSNEYDTNDTYSKVEQIKIQKMMNLLESYGFELDSTVSIKERNQELLEFDYDSVKDFLESSYNNSTEEATTGNHTLMTKSPYILNKPSQFTIYGEHKSVVSSTKTTMVLSYTPPSTHTVQVIDTKVKPNIAITWTPDEYGSFSFNDLKCENITVTGIVKFGHAYRGKYKMVGWVEKFTDGRLYNGAIEHFRPYNDEKE